MSPEATAIERDSAADRPRTRAGKVRLRSLGDLDHRTAAARKAQSLVDALLNDLGGDPSTAQRQLAMRAACLVALLEDTEAKWISGANIDAQTYGFLVGSLRRCLNALGLERKPRDVTEQSDDARLLAQFARAYRGEEVTP